MKIAIIILNYNSSADCRKCVSDLKKQSGVEIEIVIVDNCSRSDEREEIEKFCRGSCCTFLLSPENRGYNAGNNIGLHYAAEQGYEYALICNPDMEFPQDNYLKNLADILKNNSEITVIASDILHFEGYHQNPLLPDGDWKDALKGVLRTFLPWKHSRTPDYIDRWDFSHFCNKVSGCCFMIRIDFLKEIGFFDEYPFLYCEEAILAAQVVLSGKKMYYVADVQAIHHHVKKAKLDAVRGFRHWRRSRTYFIRRYSRDSWLGKQCQLITLHVMVLLFIFLNTLKKLRIR